MPFEVVNPVFRTDIYASVEFNLSPVNGSSGAFIAARVDQGGCTSYIAHGIFFFVFPDKYIIANDLGKWEKQEVKYFDSSLFRKFVQIFNPLLLSFKDFTDILRLFFHFFRLFNF